MSRPAPAIVRLAVLVVAGAAVTALSPARPTRAAELTPQAAQRRVDHHVREAEAVARHFEGVMAGECPRLASGEEWRRHLDGEVDRVVTLAAHLEQAWVEAKRTGDDGVRRAAKAPRRRLEEARALVGKLRACARGHGAEVSEVELWRRVEEALPGRQAEIALPR